MDRLPQWIRAFRLVHKQNQTEFGKLIDRKQSRVSELERGAPPSLDELRALRRVLGRSLDEMVPK